MCGKRQFPSGVARAPAIQLESPLGGCAIGMANLGGGGQTGCAVLLVVHLPFPSRLRPAFLRAGSSGLHPRSVFYAAAATWHGVNQPCLSSRVPLITPKNAFCSCSAIGPRLPLPIEILSIDRIGVISAAVPLKRS